MDKVLITGAAGYLGSCLIGRLLEEKTEVIGVDSLRYNNFFALLPYWGHPRFTFHHLDIRDSKVGDIIQKEKVDTVVHLAAIVGQSACDRAPVLAQQVNAEATKWLVQQLGSYQRLIYCNSNSGYGVWDGQNECTEESPLNPISLYGKTKVQGEEHVLGHSNAVSLRLATVFGVSLRHRWDLLVNDLTLQLSRGPFRIFQGDFWRNFVHIRDVIEVIKKMVCNFPATSGIFNVGNPACNMTKMKLAETICDTLGLSYNRILPGEGYDPDRRDYKVNNEKIMRLHQFSHSLEDGIRELAAITRIDFPKSTN